MTKLIEKKVQIANDQYRVHKKIELSKDYRKRRSDDNRLRTFHEKNGFFMKKNCPKSTGLNYISSKFANTFKMETVIESNIDIFIKS